MTARALGPRSRGARRSPARPATHSALACGVAAALAMSGATAASAAPPQQQPGKGSPSSQASNPQASNAQASNAQASNAQASNAQASNGTSAQAKPAKAATANERSATPSSASSSSARNERAGRTDSQQSRGRSAEHRANPSTPARRAESTRKADKQSAPEARKAPNGKPSPHKATGRPADPAGNNGTIKVDGPAYDTDVDNEPHVSCEFRLTFFGFDADQTADITFTGHAPTGGGLLLQETGVPISDDAAGGAALDFDGATRTYTVDDLGLSSVTPHAQQGYHVKVTVDALEAPGGAKSKVLWIEPCEDEDVLGGTTDQAPTAGGGTEPSPSVDGTTQQTPSEQVSDELVVSPTTIEATPAARVLGVRFLSARALEAGTPVAQAAGTAARTASTQAGAGTTMSAQPAVASAGQATLFSALPRTGAGDVVLLLLTGLGALATGVALRVAGRRRTNAS